MAGESPDKSDKKQSSGEAAQSGRDPRLSVLRGKPDEPATETGAADAAEDSETPEKGEAPEGSDVPQEAPGATADAEGAEGGDGRLRDAVAAWVAGKGDEGDAEESADGADGAGDAGESGSGSPASEGRASEGSGAEGSGESGSKASLSEGGSEKDGSEESSGAVKGDSEGAVAKPAAKSDAKAGVKVAAKSDAKGGKSGAKGGVKGEAKADAKTDAKAAEAEAPVDATDEAEAKTDAKVKAKVKDEPEDKADSEAKDKADSGAKAGAKAEREVVDQPTAVFKTVGAQKGASGAEGDGKADDTADEPGDGKADEPGDGGSAVDDATRVFALAKGKGKAASGEAVDQATTAFKINPPAKGRSAEQSKDTKDTSAEQANGKAAEGTKAAPGSKDSDKGKDEPASKDEAKDKGKAKDEAKGSEGASGAKGGGTAAESDAERTSQFVALKAADDSAAGRSLGKTAPRTPARTPGKDASKETSKETPKDATKDAAKDATKDVPKETSKGADKPAGKAPGASGKAAAAAGSLPAAAPAKPGTPAKPADRAGAMPPAADAGSAAAPAGLPESERTKQQPLPPLDLLAKLTNTPPPPETPLRIVVRRFKIWTPLAVLLAIIFVVAQSVRPLPDPTLTVGDATSSFTFEGGKLTIPWPAQGQAAIKVVGSGDLGTFGPQKPVPTASVAKIMTAYVILRDHPLAKDKKGPQIEVDAKAVAEGGSRSESRIEGLKAGQKFSQQDMLKMLMIPSGNNIARLLARWDSKSTDVAPFVKKMNAAAKDLGMKNTTYTDPSGLDPKTVSTAVDQLKLAEAVMKYDAFRPIVAMTNADIPGLSQRINSNIDNLLLAGLSIKGIKTGSSTAAGGTLSWAAYKTVDGKDRLILGTMMDQHFKGLDPNGSNSLTLVKDNSQKVIEAVRNALTSAPAVKKGQVVGYVDDGLNGLTPVVATKDLKAVGVPGQKLKLSVGDGGKTVPHTAKAGTEVGVLTVGNGESMQKVPVALKEDLVEPSFGAKLVRIT
ncbi:D-alanyl-D-alanine carboxypeptidase [Streptomyces lydicus]|uniref:D-alanyl-D-alanine carboxypeptidase n=1 Tax=Streptomyces lydicus TaxID=47763 RepID=UPI00378EDDEB